MRGKDLSKDFSRHLLFSEQNSSIDLQIYCSVFPGGKTSPRLLLRRKLCRQQNSQLTRRSDSGRQSSKPEAHLASAKPPHLTNNRKWRNEGKGASSSIKAAVRLIQSAGTRWEWGGGVSLIQHAVYFQPISFSANDGERNWKVVLIRHGSQLEPVSRTELGETTEAREMFRQTKTRRRKVWALTSTKYRADSHEIWIGILS